MLLFYGAFFFQMASFSNDLAVVTGAASVLLLLVHGVLIRLIFVNKSINLLWCLMLYIYMFDVIYSWPFVLIWHLLHAKLHKWLCTWTCTMVRYVCMINSISVVWESCSCKEFLVRAATVSNNGWRTPNRCDDKRWGVQEQLGCKGLSIWTVVGRSNNFMDARLSVRQPTKCTEIGGSVFTNFV